MKHLRCSYDRKVKELDVKLNELHLFNKRMQYVINALQIQL